MNHEMTTAPVDLDVDASSGSRCDQSISQEQKGTTSMSQNETTNPYVHVELDPPSQAIARWTELADRDIEIVHDGDASKIAAFPRPAWADPDNDSTGDTWAGCYYRSAYVNVVSMTAGGHDDGEVLRPAHIRVSARIHGDRVMPVIGVSVNRYLDESEKWVEFGASLPPAAALELADVLRAAVDMVGGDR